MSNVKHPEPIINSEQLREHLRACLKKGGKDAALAVRDKCHAVAKEYMEQGRAEIRRRFEAGGTAAANVSEHAWLMDQLIIELYGCAMEMAHASVSPRMVLMAVGGYGRSELFPHSDIDLLVMHGSGAQKQATEVTEFILYILWDLGLTLGQAVRDLPETLKQATQDITIRTTLLDARFICGDASLMQAFHERFTEEVVKGSELAFVEAKLAERDARHLRCGDSRYVLEPNIKEGKGGLRDLHTLYWIAKYNYRITRIAELVKLGLLTAREQKAFAQSEQFLWTVRVWLHYLTGRAEERLTFDMQRSLSAAMGYREQEDIGVRSVERFMKRYFMVAKTVGNLTRVFCAVLEEEKRRKPRKSLAGLLQRKREFDGFVLEGERLNFTDEKVVTEQPAKMLELFALAQQEGFDIHPHALRQVTRNLPRIDRDFLSDVRANELLLSMLLSNNAPEVTLRRMNEAGLLGKFIPDFGRVIGQMQFDMYHVFTVDEHTIFAIGILHGIEKGRFKDELPVATEIIHLIRSRRVLYLAVFCHDIAKGRGGDHSVLGEKIGYKLAQRFGFSKQECETVGWLVRHHLLMSSTAFKRDINDPKTIRDFVEKVQSPERLRLLLILTVADIRAVGPTIWNGWKGALLRELYYKAEAMMGAGELTAAAENREQLAQALQTLLPSWTMADIYDYLDLGTAAFWSACDAEAHARIAGMMRRARSGEPLVLDSRSDSFLAITEVTLITPDQHGLFSRAAGVIALSGANIVDCKIFTLKDGMALEIFRVQDIEGKAFDKPDKQARMASYVEMALYGQLDIEKEILRKKRPYPSRIDTFKIPPSVFIENNVSATHTVIEINGQDRVGFLYAVTKALSTLGLSIATAHISTYGERAVDVFYVKDVFGMKITHDRKLKQIESEIIAALTPQDDAVRKTG